MENDICLWERLSSESSDDYALFTHYLASPLPRSLEVFCKKSGRKYADIYALASKNRWKDRCDAWDSKVQKQVLGVVLESKIAKAKEYAEMHLEIAASMRELGAREIQNLTALAKKSDIPGLIKPREAAQLIEMGVRLEREIVQEMGLDTEGERDLDLSQLSDEEILQLSRLTEKALRKR